MNIIPPSYQIETNLEKEKDLIMQDLEKYARVCYKSEDKIKEGSAEKLISNIIKRGHLSVIEHKSITVRFIHNRGFTHELVRHRLASFSQKSTRYVNYKKGIVLIEPYWWNDVQKEVRTNWTNLMQSMENVYKRMIESGLPPQGARGILPNDLETEIVVTANLREWRTIFELRCASSAHPDMQRIMIPLREKFKSLLPIIFE